MTIGWVNKCISKLGDEITVVGTHDDECVSLNLFYTNR